MQLLCNKWCLLSSILILSSVFICLFANKKELIHNFNKTLNDEQREEFKEIREMRKNIYIKSVISAVILSGIICFIAFRKKEFKIDNICLFLALTYSFKILFYLLSKKSKYIVSTLNNQTQRDAWLNIYKNMQFNYHLGIFVGLIGVIITSIKYCNN